MKRQQQTHKWKAASKARAKKALKARVRFADYHKQKNIKKLNRSKYEIQHENEHGLNVYAPKVLSLKANPEGTIVFISKLEKYLKERQKVFVVLTEVEEIDYGAIAVLFSVMDMFNIRNIDFNGNQPQNDGARVKLHNSGFFDQLFRKNRSVIEYRTGNKNQIFTRSNKQVEASLGLPIMEEASKTIWGEKRICKGLQRILVELMHNTNNHAGGLENKGDEQWTVSVNHDVENKKVEFVFVDYGVGIFNSLNEKKKGDKWYEWQEKIKLFFGSAILETNAKLLQKLLEGEIHMTVTKKSFRGKGLPGIKEVFDRNQISSLFVLSNNAYADVANTEYKVLGKSFSGTFLYWELCYSNENHLWTIKQ